MLLLLGFPTASKAARALDRACVALEELTGREVPLNFRRQDYMREPLVQRLHGACEHACAACGLSVACVCDKSVF